MNKAMYVQELHTSRALLILQLKDDAKAYQMLPQYVYHIHYKRHSEIAGKITRTPNTDTKRSGQNG